MAWGILVKDSDGDTVINNNSLIARLMYDGPAEGPYYTNYTWSNTSLNGMNYVTGTTNYCVGNGDDNLVYLDGVSGYGFSTSSSLCLVLTEEVEYDLDVNNWIPFGPTSSPLNFKNTLVQAWDYNSTYLVSECEQGYPTSLGNGAYGSLDYHWYEVRNKIRPIVIYFG